MTARQYAMGYKCISLLASAALLALCFVLPGCGRGEVRGRIAGKVTVEGKPVSAGYVTFTNLDKGVNLNFDIDPDGKYEVLTSKAAGLPVGITYKVSVFPIREYPPGQPNARPIKPYPKVPPKYLDPQTSGLIIKVHEGDNSFDIVM
jgi:hypothetical protein